MEDEHIIISTAIRNRTCLACGNKIEPGIRHVKIYHSNVCNHCFLKASMRILGPDYFRQEVVNTILPEIISEEV